MLKNSSGLLGYTGLALLARLLNIISVLLFARALKPADFGMLAFLQASAALIVTLAGFNLPAPMTVVLARGGANRVRLQNSILTILFSAIGIVAASAAGLALIFTFPQLPLHTEGRVWFVALTVASALQIIGAAALIARKQRLISAGCTLVGGVILTLVLLNSQNLDLTAALRLSTLSMMPGVLIASGILFANGFESNFRHVGSSLITFLKRSGRPILLFSINSFAASFLFQFALWYLQRQLLVTAGPAESAIFALGNQFYNVVIFLPGIFGPLLLRHLSTLPTDRERFGPVWQAGTTALILCTLGIAIFYVGFPLISIVFPAKYKIAALPLVLAVSAGALMFVKFPFSVFFQAKIAARPELYASLFSAVLLLIGAKISLFVEGATASLWLRITAHLVQLVIVAGFFTHSWSKGRSVDAHR